MTRFVRHWPGPSRDTSAQHGGLRALGWRPGRAGDGAPAAAAAGISIRTGCFCNPGAAEGAFNLTKADWRRAARGQARTLDQYLDLLGLPSGGALRASVGLASNIDDVERFLAFVEMTYRNRVVGTAGLAPRQGC